MHTTNLLFIEDIQGKIINEFLYLGAQTYMANLLAAMVSLALLLLLCRISLWFTNKVVVRMIEHFIQKTPNAYDDFLIQHRLFHRLAHLVPAIMLWIGSGSLFPAFPSLATLLADVAQVYLVWVFVRALHAAINALHDLYNSMGYSQARPIKGYVQMAHIVVYFVAVLTVVAILFEVSLLAVFTSLGAVAAVLLLIFKDTILGITASIQLSANDMVKTGDWISMPSHNADGVVIEITLYAVKVQNWDKTISTIPPYELVSRSFTNWKGMSEAGARRIKRSISVDVKSVKFCTPEMLARFRRIALLDRYIDEKTMELDVYNQSHPWDLEVAVNGHRLTNIGVFRKYLELYLTNHPSIHQHMSLLVRQLQPSETGIPIEIYSFVNNPEWAKYENVQSDIFDHVLAIVGEFELRVFQNPSGDDLLKWSKNHND